MYLVMAHVDVVEFEFMDEYGCPEWSTQGSWWPPGCANNSISPEPRDADGWELWGFMGFPEHASEAVHV